VVALDVKTGQQKWTTQLPGSSACDPVGVDGNALLVAADQLWTGCAGGVLAGLVLLGLLGFLGVPV
jgi:outer membrane protein assembly factor BamB